MAERWGGKPESPHPGDPVPEPQWTESETTTEVTFPLAVDVHLNFDDFEESPEFVEEDFLSLFHARMSNVPGVPTEKVWEAYDSVETVLNNFKVKKATREQVVAEIRKWVTLSD